MTFPIRIEKTCFESSDAWAGLQLADILAGAMTRCMKWIMSGKAPNDDYARKLADIMPNAFGGHTLLPSAQFSPEELGTTAPDSADAIQHFVKLIRGL